MDLKEDRLVTQIFLLTFSFKILTQRLRARFTSPTPLAPAEVECPPPMP